ncbi:MAG TPA: MBL fold metallo-hydrolase [Candidatus Wallbacteria bacterium]|nr:MBL fold metallo-hydrolase [Candidatus Wallbacteria bacterium]
MKTKIIYIHHNCFILEYGETAFLFDMPASSFLKLGETETIKTNIRGKKLFVFASHAHPDHYSSDIFKLSNVCPDARYIISDDIAAPSKNNLLIAKAEKTYELGELTIKTFKSNDAGLAYLIKTPEIIVYFGGDLAKWSWDDFDEETRNYMEKVFAGAISILKKESIDVAFSNADARLPNYSGAAEFIEAVRPKLFVPMHSFGDTAAIKEFIKTAGTAGTKIFAYSRPGDAISF